jgi:hypothetical protein
MIIPYGRGTGDRYQEQLADGRTLLGGERDAKKLPDSTWETRRWNTRGKRFSAKRW